MKDKDWESAGGVFCSECNQETVQLIGGLCPQCSKSREAERMERVEDKTMRRYYRRKLNEGTISLADLKEGHP